MSDFSTPYDILTELETKLDKSKRTGDKLKARCPAHEDKTPSLDATIGRDGDRVVLVCRSQHCTTEAIVAAIGWTMHDLFVSDANRPPVSSSRRVYVLDPSKLPGVPDPLPKGWGANDWDVPAGVDVLAAMRGAVRLHEARAIGDEADAAKREASSLPLDTPGRVRLWIDALTDADLDAQLRVLHLIAGSGEWQQLDTALRIAVVGAVKRGTATSMAAAILGRFDDRKLAWRDPPGAEVDTSDPDVVSLATLLADPPDPSATVARGLAFGGTMGFIRGPKASGKTTVLAAAAARVSRGEPWAGQDTEAGTVLVVCNDDPRSWTLALRDFGADPERLLMARARVVSRPGKLAALLAEHTPAWVIIDNLRTWCRSMHLDTDNSSAAADAIDPIAEAIRECGYPVACTIVHNEARSKGEGVIVKGVPGSAYAARMRNSTVFEDAADWIVGCAHADGSTTTTIMAGEKTRREIPTETLIIDLDLGGHGTPSTGGGDDPFNVGTPVNQLDEKITGYLMANPQGVSLRAIRQAVKGRASQTDARLKLVGECGPDKLWRPNRGACPVAEIEGGGDTGHTVSRDRVPPLVPLAGHAGTHCVPPIGDTGSGHGVRDTVAGHGRGDHPTVDRPLLASANPPPPTPPQGDVKGTLFCGDNKAKAEPVAVNHEKSCPKCFGKGLDAFGNPCNYVRPVEPGVHTSGIKKWDDATSTWVDTIPDPFVLDPVRNGVHLSDGTSVRDGDPSVHWGERWNDIELEQEGRMVH